MIPIINATTAEASVAFVILSVTLVISLLPTIPTSDQPVTSSLTTDTVTGVPSILSVYVLTTFFLSSDNALKSLQNLALLTEPENDLSSLLSTRISPFSSTRRT